MGEKILMMQPRINTGRHAELEHVYHLYVDGWLNLEGG